MDISGALLAFVLAVMAMMSAVVIAESTAVEVGIDAGPWDCGAQGSNVQARYDAEEGVLIIEGQGEMMDYIEIVDGKEVKKEPGWSSEGVSFSSIIIKNGVRAIGSGAFQWLSAEHLDVTIPNSVTSIGYGAFEDCQGITSMKIPGSVLSIGDRAFCGCRSLRTIELASGTEVIGSEAFYLCMGLESIAIPSSVTFIKDNTFNCCKSLSSITILGNVISIEEGAFKSCSALTSIDIPDSVTSIGEQAFFGSGLTSMSIPSGVASIEAGTFAGTKLVSVEIPGTVRTIGEGAFGGCGSLISATIQDGVVSIGDKAFWKSSKLASVRISDTVTSMGSKVFTGCKSLNEVAFGSGLTTLGEESLGKKFYDLDGESELAEPDELRGSTFRLNGAGKLVKVPKHSVTYDPNQGVGAVPIQPDVAEGDSFRVMDYTGSKEGFIFGGWSYAGTVYGAGDTIVMPDSDITLIAEWVKDIPKFEVSYDLNGGSGTVPGLAYYHSGDSITVCATDPSRYWHTFRGWSCDDAIYHAGEEVVVNSDMKFVAVWAEGPFPVLIIPDDGQDVFETVVRDDAGTGSEGNGKTIVIIAIVIAIIAELAVLTISKKG